MKKILFIFLLLFTFQNTNAQTWCPQGATWYYGATDGYSKLFYTSDTTINSITCKKISTYSEWYFGGTFFSALGETYYTYSNGSGVNYIYNNKYGNNKFDTLFDINAQIGDTWRMPLADTTCNDTLNYVTVLNTGNITINTFSLKWLYVKFRAHGFESFDYVMYDTIIENIGFIKNYFIYPTVCMIATEFGYSGLRCYSDDTFGNYIRVTTACDFTVSINEKINISEYNIYPNPATSTISIESLKYEVQRIIILDVLGREVFKSTKNDVLSTKNIDVSQLPSGIYILQMPSKNGVVSKKFVKE